MNEENWKNYTYYIEANGTKEFEKELEKYKYTKKVFLDSDNLREKDTITQIQNVLNRKNIKNNKEFETILNKNLIFELKRNIQFNIKKITYKFCEGKFIIINCVIIFLLYNEDFLNFLNEFIDNIKVGNINLKFPEAKKVDGIRENCAEMLSELLKENFSKKIDESELIDFFKEKEVIYSGKVKLNEIRNLKDVMKEIKPFCNTDIKGILITFVSSEDIDINIISDKIKDINFYIGNRIKDILYAIKVDENIEETIIKVTLVQ